MESSVTRLNNYLQARNELHLLAWIPHSDGPSDALIWTMECRVNGQTLGTGAANQVRVAKEIAAHLACQELGILANRDDFRGVSKQGRTLAAQIVPPVGTTIQNDYFRVLCSMYRRLTPFLFAGLLGVISGVYIFKPLLEDSAAQREFRGATNAAASSAEKPQPRLDTAPPQQGK